MAAMDSPKKRNGGVSQRRHNKPLIEKRRRARINECLAQLQSLVLKAKATEGPRPSKLEKADILEMTVDYIKKTKPGQDEDLKSASEPEVQHQYTAGYEKCIKEVLQFLEQQNHVADDIRDKISSHCHDKLHEKSKATISEEMDGIKCERSEDESDNQSTSAPSSPDIPTVAIPADAAKPEERYNVQNMAYVSPLQQQPHQHPQQQQQQQQQQVSSPESSPIKQATLQQLSGPIKLVCGGDILILLDSSASQNIQSISSLPKLQFAPSPIQNAPEIYQPYTGNLLNGCVTSSAVPFPVYRLSNITGIPISGLPISGVPISGGLPISGGVQISGVQTATTFQPFNIQNQPAAKLISSVDVNNNNNIQPLVENYHMLANSSPDAMWRPW